MSRLPLLDEQTAAPSFIVSGGAPNVAGQTGADQTRAHEGGPPIASPEGGDRSPMHSGDRVSRGRRPKVGRWLVLLLPVVIGLVAPAASWGVAPDDPAEVPPNERLDVPAEPTPLAAVAPAAPLAAPLAPPPPPSSGWQPLRVSAAGPLRLDAGGDLWLADTGFQGGAVAGPFDAEIAGTKDDWLYDKHRWGMQRYSFAAPPGTYRVVVGTWRRRSSRPPVAGCSTSPPRAPGCSTTWTWSQPWGRAPPCSWTSTSPSATAGSTSGSFR